ncbi:NAD(P)-binding domain-containing protein [Umezawaea sp. Da 62-37]|uniref:NADPH-dependent F420 reductase n=1 Tax=Umezawaea sp. Da 62-37 TaxID=3075927 RepID=UPI0028F7095B|nr:NAD(P)-binding domain-containing protein [Umezawaea sp. Da 62-37]WNV86809.1 NAD(P)-binding domain-containing protein [Umezawaea sp. Da 62-37]
MRIAILGTGAVGRALAGRLVELGHDVTAGTRDVDTTRARPGWGAGSPGLAGFAEAAAGAELVVHACGGSAALDVLVAAGADNLAGKVLLDVSNPLDFSGGFPPSLFVKDTDSLAERIQRTFPATRVVKSLNTVTAELMVAPDAAGAEITMFVAGDDPDAKAVVVGLLRDFGWRDVLDLGDLTGARAMEMHLPLWLRLSGTLGTSSFGVKVVR